MADIMAAFDTAALLAFITTAGVAVVGIAIAPKAIDIAKRMIRKA